MLYRSGSGIWRIGQSGVATAPAASSNWWLADGIDPANCVAAYQAIGAASQAASYVNLANPGTNDATPGVAPTWATETGWTFNGSTQYLDTGVVAGNGWSMIVRFSDMAGSGIICGKRLGNANQEFTIIVNTLINVRYYRYPADSMLAGAVVAGVMGIGGTRAYLNGTDEGISLGGTSTAALPVFVGAVNANGVPGAYATCRVQAFCLYDVALSAGNMATISTAMAALS